MRSQVIELPPTDYWEREKELPGEVTVAEDCAPTEPLPRTSHREPKPPVWDGLTKTRWGWYALLSWTFVTAFIVTLEVLAIRHHVSF